MRLHHVGIVTQNLEKSIGIYTELGYEKIAESREEEIQVNLVLMKKKGDSTLVELVFPMNKSGPAQAWVKKIGAGAYHTCYVVKDFQKQCDFFKEKGFHEVLAPVGAKIFGGKKVVFFFSTSIGLVELLEE